MLNLYSHSDEKMISDKTDKDNSKWETGVIDEGVLPGRCSLEKQGEHGRHQTTALEIDEEKYREMFESSEEEEFEGFATERKSWSKELNKY